MSLAPRERRAYNSPNQVSHRRTRGRIRFLLTSTIIKRAVGVSGALASSCGIGLAGAAPAEAAATVWDRVAKCESGGNWKINTGNGYYGGLQFAACTWKADGGRTYASQAHRATEAEQIAIARRVLAGQGPGA